MDEDSFVEHDAGMKSTDPLSFHIDTKKYKDRLSQAQKSTGERDALIVVKGCLCGMPVVASAFEFRFIGGSMGSVVGERFVRGVAAAPSYSPSAGQS